MEIFAKRRIADGLDYFLFALILALFRVLRIPFLGEIHDPLFYLIMIYPIEMRDFLFKGASLGKVIVGIRIYDQNWKKPSYATLLRRELFISHLIGLRANYHSPHKITKYEIILTEKNKFFTRVVDRKMFKKFDQMAKTLPGRWEDNMSDLYDMYIADVYKTKADEIYK